MDGYIEFDNRPFKFAVAQVLMYDLKLLGEPYSGGDEYFKVYKDDYAEVSDEECIRRLKPFIERGMDFFTELKIPCSLAPKIQYLYVGEELSVYYNINPQWLDLEEYDDGSAFDITDISEHEIKQFPNLKGITFNMYSDPPKELLQKLKEWGIEINPQF